MRFARYFAAPALAVLLGGSIAFAQMVEQHTTEKTTTYRGVVSSVDPASSTIILRSDSASAPSRYTFNKETVFVDPQGKIVTSDAIKDAPVTISYVQDGDRVIVTKVEQTGPAVRKETTTTTTTETR
jgi:hypothetical protein